MAQVGLPVMKKALTAFMLAVDVWCYLRHPIVMGNAVIRARCLLSPATPRTTTEKFLWRKLFDHNPLHSLACDKLRAKTYALARCPELKTAAVLWVGTDPDAIPEAMLDRNAVMKANHGSGWNVIDLDQIAPELLRAKAMKWMRQRTYGWKLGEWGYRDVPRKIFLEQCLRVDGLPVQSEFKFHVCSGRIAYVYVKLPVSDAGNIKMVLDREGTAFVIDEAGVTQRPDIEPPRQFHKMRELAEHLAGEFDFVRCDFYDMPDGIYFSELTVYPMSGHGNIGHQQLVDLRNSLWDIRRSWFLTTKQRGLTRLYASALVSWLHQRDVTTEGRQGI